MKKLIKSLLFVVIAITLLFISSKVEYSYADESYPFEATVINAGGANVNSGPNSGSFVNEIAFGTRVTVTGPKQNGFYPVSYNSGKTGYVASSLIANVSINTLTSDFEGIETYRAYCDTLIANGFVESYCPYLYYLHSKHPLWIFKADRVLVSIEEASSNEEGKCSLQTDNDNFKIIVGTSNINEYSCINGVCHNYYWVNSKVISAYLDPRNSMFENTIFQFFDSDDNKDLGSDLTLTNIVGTGGNLFQYLQSFKDAASYNGINVVQLVSRSKQEGANNPAYPPVTGTTNWVYNENSLNGFYNFYNIGASGTNPQLQGLVFAAAYFNPNYYTFQRPWDSPQKAISGGAEFLASSYIKAGQDTPFYQKFNISSYSTKNKYTSQYMTNIAAPISEGVSMYGTYKSSGELDQAFTFTIPVYENMSDTPYQAVDRSNISSLDNISINGNTILGFDKDVTEYYLNIPTDENTINITAVATNGGASINGIGDVSFVDGYVVVTINVVSEDKTTSTNYVLNIRKISSGTNITVEQVLSNVDVKVDNNFMYGISPGTVANTIISTVVKNGGNASIKDANGNIKTTGNLATGDVITVSGTSEVYTYKIAVRGDTSGDGIVKINDLILIQSHILGKVVLSEEKLYAGDLNYDGVSKINDLVMVQSYILGKIVL